MNTNFTPFRISIPATSANLGSSFDCLGLSLSLFNETTFSPSDSDLKIHISGFGTSQIPKNRNNYIFRAMKLVEKYSQKPLPANMRISCENNIPISSGLGSSAAASLTGILAANRILEANLSSQQIYQLGIQLEGHIDNLIAAHIGSLQLIIQSSQQFDIFSLPIADWEMLIITPIFNLSTKDSRNILPDNIPIATVVDAIAKSNLSIDALRTGDAEKLIFALNDTLHQPHRIPIIPGVAEILAHLNSIGVPAAMSGAGPSVIAFGNQTTPPFSTVLEKINRIFAMENIPFSTIFLEIDREGAVIS